jgi:hypothetical protein
MVNDWVTWFYFAPAVMGAANLLLSLGKGWGIFALLGGTLSRIVRVLSSTGIILISVGLLSTGRLGFQLPEAIANALMVFGFSLALLSLLGVRAILWVRTHYQRLPPQLRGLGEQEGVAYERQIREMRASHEARRQARAARRQAS